MRNVKCQMTNVKCRTLRLVAVLALAAGAASAQNWTQLGFSAEPGVSVGTPCVLNLMARFWYHGFGISGCGLWLPSGFNYLNGSGAEGDVMYRLFMPGVSVQPFVALGYGSSSVSSSVSGINPMTLTTQYVGLQVGAYYMGAFAQVGVGVGKFTIGSAKSPVFPLLEIGYTGSIGSSSSSSGGSSGGSGSGGSSGGGSSGGGHTK